MDEKRIQCLSNASQHVSIYLQPFPSNSTSKFKRLPFLAHFLHILASTGYAPGTIAVTVTRVERGSNACKTPRCMYPSIFNHFCDIAIYRWRVIDFQQYREVNERPFYHILISPGYARGSIAVNVTRLEERFNACKTSRRIYPSIFNRF